MSNESLGLINIQDYLDSLRLAAALDDTLSYETILKDFNLMEFKDFDFEKLKKLEYSAYLYHYLAFDRSDDGIEGVLAYTITSEKYMIFLTMVISNLLEIYAKCKNDKMILNGKFISYINYCRVKKEFQYESPDNNKLVGEQAYYSMLYLVKFRDFLFEKGKSILENSIIKISVSIERDTD